VIGALPGLCDQDNVTELGKLESTFTVRGAEVKVVTVLFTEYPDTPPAVVAVTT
jgi:hypothetical protein